MRFKVEKRIAIAAAAPLAGVFVAAREIPSARADQVVLPAAQDATLFGGSDASGNKSASGPGIFAGTDGNDSAKRGLIEFDFDSIPSDATITGVTLEMDAGQIAGTGGGGNAPNPSETISLYNESQAWSQSTNGAGIGSFPGTGHGFAANNGDATWNDEVWENSGTPTAWNIAGGDWSASLADQADTVVGTALQAYSWSSGDMEADVQNWVENPSANFGWIVKCQDEVTSTDFRAFWSAQGAAAYLAANPTNPGDVSAPALMLTYTISAPATAYWSGAQAGSAGLVWSTASPGTNWSATDGGGDLGQIPGGGVTNVIFGATGNGAGVLTTTLGADFSINSLTFSSARTNSVIIGGANSLTIGAGGLTIQPGSGSHVINATGDSAAGTPGIVLGANQTWTDNSSNVFLVQSSIGDGGNGYSLSTGGSGAIELNGANTYTGGTAVTGGSLIIGTGGALPDGPVKITGGTLQLAPSTGLAAVTSLSITGAGQLDVSNNHIIISYGSVANDPIASIAALLTSGYNGGNWNGPGIISSTAAVTQGYGLGYADSADAGDPAGLSSGTMEIKYTLLGDATLQGLVNGTDFGILAANFNKGISAWDGGDFFYHGVVNGQDFGALAANFNKGATGASFGPGALSDPALVAFAQANGFMADVPEPAGLTVLAFGTGSLLSRRRRGDRARGMLAEANGNKKIVATGAMSG